MKLSVPSLPVTPHLIQHEGQSSSHACKALYDLPLTCFTSSLLFCPNLSDFRPHSPTDAQSCLMTFASAASIWDAHFSGSWVASSLISFMILLKCHLLIGVFLHAVYFTLRPSLLPSIPLPPLFSPPNTLVILFTVFLLPLEHKLYEGRNFCMFCSCTV